MKLHIGEFEELVLLAVYALTDQVYAVPVQQRIETKTGRRTTMGAVYAALERLEKKGMVTSWLGEVTQVRGGKRKRLYRITAHGQQALHAAQQARQALLGGQAWPAFGNG